MPLLDWLHRAAVRKHRRFGAGRCSSGRCHGRTLRTLRLWSGHWWRIGGGWGGMNGKPFQRMTKRS